MRDDSTRHLSPAELAERQGVPLETVYAWNKDGTAPMRLRLGRHVRYRLTDVNCGGLAHHRPRQDRVEPKRPAPGSSPSRRPIAKLNWQHWLRKVHHDYS